jgi:hypothetical protein
MNLIMGKKSITQIEEHSTEINDLHSAEMSRS